MVASATSSVPILIRPEASEMMGEAMAMTANPMKRKNHFFIYVG